jgi:3-oxoacyl-[acyl-carrier protein] reductase
MRIEGAGTMTKRVVLVTGAARGLGEAVTRRFHHAGYNVALADIAVDAA